jgi:uncharacterized protein (TIGR02600 family)
MKKIFDFSPAISALRACGPGGPACRALGRRKSAAPNARKGVALISVLAIVVLLTALVLGFLMRASSERVASRNYDAASTTRLLSDTAVNLVQAAINEATTVSGSAWASQPGMIRVYTNTGTLDSLYRLYSAPQLVTKTTNPAILANDVPDDTWLASPALWVDLNAPVLVPETVDDQGAAVDEHLVYPILDPRDPTSPGTAARPNVMAAMPGFSITNAPDAPANQPAPMPVRWLYVLQNGEIVAPSGSGSVVTINGASASNPIIGRIAFWTDDETAKVNLNTAAGSFASWGGTRIPGTWDTPRFKAWYERMLFSENQPVKGEYQRYPGHPATTDLFSILNALGDSPADYPYAVSNPTVSPQPDVTMAAAAFFKFRPRYTDANSSRGGSRNSTRVANAGAAPVINGGVAKQERLFPAVGEMMYDPQRNMSGLTRQQLESGKFFLTAQSRAPELTLFGTPRMALWPVDSQNVSSRRTAFDRLIAFCATTGTGGAKYPYFVQRSNSRNTTSDYDNIPRNQDLFAYLQSLTSRTIPGFGGNFTGKYSFTRAGTTERDEILALMMDYIRCTNLHDNSVAGSSLVRFTDNPGTVPSGSNTFQGQAVPMKIVEGGSTARGIGRAYTFSEIGIHMICTADGNSPLGAYQNPVMVGTQLVSPVKGSANDAPYASNLPVAQYLRNGTGTNGQIVGWDSALKTITTGTETALPSTGGPFPANQTLTTTGDYGGALQALAPGEKKLQAMLLFDIACPMMGYDPFLMSIKPAFRVNVAGIEGISIGAQNPFPSRTTTSNSTAAGLNGNGFVDGIATRTLAYGTGGTLGFRYLLGEQGEHFNGWSGITPSGFSGPRPYRYVSNPFKVSTASSLSLSGGFTAELHCLTSTTTSDAYQTFNVAFPAVSNIPIPDLVINGLAGPNASGGAFTANFPADWWGFDFRISRANQPRTGPIQSVAYAGPGAVIRSEAPLVGTWQWNQTRQVRIPTFANQSSNAALYTGADVVRTLVARDGDYRLAAASDPVAANGTNSSPFAKGPGYDAGVRLGHVFKEQSNSFNTAGVDNSGKLVAGANYSWKFTPKVPSTLNNPQIQSTWDWDNGLPNDPDGAYAGKPDEGNIYTNNDSPYYNQQEAGDANKIPAYFTANRIVNSSVMFGSLPSGVMENIPWRTLLFRPQMNRPQDPSGPKDHLFLDLFWMPVVEPYAISEPFSTAGKVNMNYQIVPFTYIHRSTAVQDVLSSELVPRVPKAAAAATSSASTGNGDCYYKGKPGATASTPPGAPSVARLPLNLSETDGTLRQFKDKFDSWKIFKSASEICEVYLTPQGYSWTSDNAADSSWYGDDFAMVGDNARERPYGNIYPRLTTKSNTFTVHCKVQALKNPIGMAANQWNEDRGKVQGEYRGSTTLERYLNPNNGGIQDYATNSSAQSLDNYYQWRVVSNTSFSP